MSMNDSERKEFANEVILEIARRISNLDITGCHLMTDLKNFVIVTGFPKFKNTKNANDTDLELLGKHFTRKEAYNMCQSIAERLCHICTNAESYHWSFDMWYAMAEIMKMFKIRPNNEFTYFINCFLAINVDIEKDSGESDEVNFMKKLKMLHLLGTPKSGKSSLQTWQVKQNLF